MRQILGADGSLAAVSTWADEVRPSRPETAPWHYIDIPLNASAIDPARKGDAPKFVVHFVADLHQPLHSADNHDRGGNNVHVTFFGYNTNLHSVWDTLLIERINPDTESYAKRLDATLSDSYTSKFEQGTLEDWDSKPMPSL